MNARFKSCAIVAIITICLLSFSTVAFSQTVTLHVNEGSEATNPDGLSWGTAFPFLQDALTEAENLLSDIFDPPDRVDIWVAQGVYLPDRSAASPDGICYGDPFKCDSQATFTIPDNVRVFGGFTGDETETSLEDRNGGVHDPTLTILSGDLLDDDDPNDLLFTTSDNSSHVVTFQNTSHNARLDTVTVIGAASGTGTFVAGVRINSSDAIISN